jgi:hypothetical protein
MSIRRRALTTTRALACAGALAAVLVGCDGKKPVPEAGHGMPPLDPAAVAAAPSPKTRAEHPMVDPMEPAMPAGHPHVAEAGAKGANPHGGPDDPALEAATPGDIAYDDKTVIAGVLKLDPKLKDKVKEGDVIYLVARRPPQGTAPGPVVAVRRLEATSFPMSFQLDSRDAMLAGGTKMEGPLVLTARVDKDGDAMTKNPGDVTGALPIKALPVAKVALVLDTVL